MNAKDRKNEIYAMLRHAGAAVSASSMAAELGVSRQVIVADISLLRAAGHDIAATPRGYVLNHIIRHDENQYLGKITSKHSAADTRTELYEIINHGGIIVNVMIDHELYGSITGALNLKTHTDVDTFLDRLAASQEKLLLCLTPGGIHQHTIACRDRAHFDEIVQALTAKQLLHQ